MGGVDNTHSGDWLLLTSILTKAKPGTVTTAAKFKATRQAKKMNLTTTLYHISDLYLMVQLGIITGVVLLARYALKKIKQFGR